MEKKRRFSQYINYIKRKKEAKLALFYSVFYFVFITLLLVFGTQAHGQTPGIYVKVAEPKSEVLMHPIERMMTNIYNIKMSGDFDKDYVAIMKAFQEGGKDLSGIYAKAGTDPKLVESAKVSKVELKERSKQLKGYNTVADSRAIQQRNNDLMSTINKMVNEMKRKGHTGDFNTDYAAIMVLYNWAGAELSKAELRYGMNTALKEESRDLIEEFSSNENLLMEWFNKDKVAFR